MPPSALEIGRIVDLFQGLVAKGFTPNTLYDLPRQDGERREVLLRELALALDGCDPSGGGLPLASEMVDRLSEFQEQLRLDVEAALHNDPAARSSMEVEACYPGFRATACHRLAHALWEEGALLLARMLAESAHSQTGIDIHPGAKIGESFFIDHGTGVVVGETAEIGKNVVLFMGVTLGALKFPRDRSGRVVRLTKRHPTLDNDVTVYSNATILGGDTHVGSGCVIGANVWLTDSVEPGTLVLQQPPRHHHRRRPRPRPASVKTPSSTPTP
ncbi:MAG: serine acetyltransferase [Planctomycetota bacterium]|nr:MAG: serine acetyltransferase [Planctomycetota bacterium]